MNQCPASVFALLLVPVLIQGPAAAQTETVRHSMSGAREFGNAVAVSGDTAFVGAQTTPGVGGRPEMGEVHVWRRGATGWSEVQVLRAPGVHDYEHMGVSVSASGNRLAVGTLGYGVRLYRFDGARWVADQELTPPSASRSQIFGVFVDLDGDRLAVSDQFEDGAFADSGAAYVYVRTSRGWILEQRVAPLDPEEDDYAGYPALHGDTLVIGVPGKQGMSGAAYVFERRGATWSQTQRIVPAGLQVNDFFGARIGFDGATLLVAAPNGDGAVPDTGTVHVFTRPATSWVAQGMLLDPNGQAHDSFGSSCQVAGDSAVIGAYEGITGPDGGAALVFRRGIAGWQRFAELRASDAAPQDSLGFSSALDDRSVLVGAPGRDGTGTNAGAVYEFRLLGDGVTLVPGRGLNPDALRSDAAVIGQSWEATIGLRGPRVPGPAYLVVGEKIGPGQLVFGGEWLLDGRMRSLLGPASHAGDGTTISFSLGMPNSPALIGVPWAAQGIVCGGRITFTDAVTGTIR